MEHLLLINFIFLIAILPIFYIRRTFFRRNIFLGRFIGNYIFITHYIFFLLIILGVVNYFYRLSNLNIMTIAFIVLPVFFIYAYYNFSIARVIKNDIQLEKYKTGKKIRIAFISDVHLSALTNKDNIEISLKRMAEEEPDILLIGGDLVDFSCKDIKADFSSSFREIEPKYGMYAILGNHEYHGGIDENIKYIESLGIKILRDDILKIEGINIIGRDDITNKKRKKIAYLKKKVNTDLPIILLDHNPNSISEAIVNRIDLELCGHTHRGQFFPYNLIVKKMYKNYHGYKKFGITHTIVSAGFSSWLIPYRVNSTSEINIIDLYY
ncbi:metallophosphoesterase [Cetobacterium somerae]|uniref:metallophosphoesterase n=1 Tax=Cetobacterium sp. NK01 TaxID=2993530 RepID=UPI002115DF04|nr:metallophosphoesterase [Cetobacterium sp. NK01]MCQ8211322.1 metallophosphoesterase [Cetobacterium sp. NK01]